MAKFKKTENTVISNMGEIVMSELDALRAEYKEKCKQAFNSLTKTLFETYPQVKTIYWAQWVPGFNDGDPCTFTMGEINFSPVDYREIDGPNFGDEVEDGSGNENFSVPWNLDNVTDAFQIDLKAMNDVINNLSDHLEDVFGSHAFIRIHKDGIEEEDYDCGY